MPEPITTEDLPLESPGEELEDGLDELTVGGEPEEPEFSYDENADNLVFAFEEHRVGRLALEQLSEKVLREWKLDWDSQEEYREQCARDWQVFCCKLEEKSVPFKDCANLNVPLMIENITRLHSRMMVEIFGDWTAFARAVPFGPDDEPVADVVSMHTNYQLAFATKGFRREMDRALLYTIVRGDVFGHSYYDEDHRYNCHEVLSSDSFVIPFTMVTTKSDLSDVPRRFKVLRRYRHELQAKEGDWANVDKILENKPITDIHDDPRPTQRLAEAELSKIEVPPQDDGRPYTILHYEGYDDGILPNQPGRDRFIQLYIEQNTGQILKLQIWEEEDYRDRLRYEAELQQLEAYRASLQMREQTINAQLGQMVYQMPDMAPDQLATMEQRMRSGMPLDVPPPQWAEDPSDPDAAPEAPRQKPIQLFSHAVYIENLSGALGVAPGRIQADHNRAANILIDQFVDQATLNNTPFGIASRSLNLPEVFDVRPGTWKKVDADPADLKDGLREWRPGPANPQVVELVDKVKDWSQASLQSPGVLSGQEGKSGETWRGIASRIEQATKQLSYGGQKFVHEFVGQILENNAYLNSLYLPETELQYLFNHLIGQNQQVMVSREMYARRYDWHLRADLRFATKAQRIGEADELVQMAMGIPALAMNPAFMYAVISQALEARGKHDLVAKLGAPPSPPPQFMLPMPVPPGGPQGQ